MTSPFPLMQTTLIQVFGVTATFQSQTYAPASEITGIIRHPPMMEDGLPASTHGVTNILFFVRYADIQPTPQVGDTITLNTVAYGVIDIRVDRQGGATLVLRRNA